MLYSVYYVWNNNYILYYVTHNIENKGFWRTFVRQSSRKFYKKLTRPLLSIKTAGADEKYSDLADSAKKSRCKVHSKKEKQNLRKNGKLRRNRKLYYGNDGRNRIHRKITFLAYIEATRRISWRRIVAYAMTERGFKTQRESFPFRYNFAIVLSA